MVFIAINIVQFVFTRRSLPLNAFHALSVCSLWKRICHNCSLALSVFRILFFFQSALFAQGPSKF